MIEYSSQRQPSSQQQRERSTVISNPDAQATLLRSRYLIEQENKLQENKPNIYEGLPDNPTVHAVKGRLVEAISRPPRAGQLQGVVEASHIPELIDTRDIVRRYTNDADPSVREKALAALAPVEQSAQEELDTLVKERRSKFQSQFSGTVVRECC